jgi:L-arabinonolactonase
MWSAHWGGGAIVRYSPNGQVDYVLPVPVSQPTCICFGGPDLSLLCVSTARDGLSTEELRLQPEAGNVLIYRTGHRGVPEEEYQP